MLTTRTTSYTRIYVDRERCRERGFMSFEGGIDSDAGSSQPGPQAWAGRSVAPVSAPVSAGRRTRGGRSREAGAGSRLTSGQRAAPLLRSARSASGSRRGEAQGSLARAAQLSHPARARVRCARTHARSVARARTHTHTTEDARCVGRSACTATHARTCAHRDALTHVHAQTALRARVLWASVPCRSEGEGRAGEGRVGRTVWARLRTRNNGNGGRSRTPARERCGSSSHPSQFYNVSIPARAHRAATTADNAPILHGGCGGGDGGEGGGLSASAVGAAAGRAPDRSQVVPPRLPVATAVATVASPLQLPLPSLSLLCPHVLAVSLVFNPSVVSTGPPLSPARSCPPSSPTPPTLQPPIPASSKPPALQTPAARACISSLSGRAGTLALLGCAGWFSTLHPPPFPPPPPPPPNEYTHL